LDPSKINDTVDSIVGHLENCDLETLNTLRPLLKKLIDEIETSVHQAKTNQKQNLRTENPHKTCFAHGSVAKRVKRFYFRMQSVIRFVEKVDDQLRVGPEKKMIIHNMSDTGIALLSPQPMKRGQNVHITIPNLEGLKMKPLIAVVIRCQDHGDGWYTIGSKFLQPPSAELLNKIKTTTAVIEEINRSE